MPTLSGLAEDGGIELRWTHRLEAPFARYELLRRRGGVGQAEAPFTSLCVLEPAGREGLRFRDRLVRPGETYVYALVAHDLDGNTKRGNELRVRSAPPGAAGLVLLSPPELRRGEQLTIACALGASGMARLSVHDANGLERHVLRAAVLPAGEHEIRWDGLDRRGNPLGPGVYTLRFEAAGECLARPITLLGWD